MNDSGKLIAIVGNSGVGKTALARRLSTRLGLALGLEQHQERPFQQAFAEGRPGSALANQVDYLLLRAEQELNLRRRPGLGVVDGGLELDFHVFTRHFYRQGRLDAAGLALCERLYAFIRQALPPPDVFVCLHAPPEVIAARFARRGRPLEIARLDDLASLQALLDEWLASQPDLTRVDVDASPDDPEFTTLLPDLLARLSPLLPEMAHP